MRKHGCDLSRTCTLGWSADTLDTVLYYDAHKYTYSNNKHNKDFSMHFFRHRRTPWQLMLNRFCFIFAPTPSTFPAFSGGKKNSGAPLCIISQSRTTIVAKLAGQLPHIKQEMSYDTYAPLTFTFDLVTPKSIGVIY